MRAMRWDAEDERDDRNWQHTLEREKVTDHYKEAADARAQAKADRDAAMAELRMELMEGRIDQQEAAARAKKIEADYADAYWQSRIGKNNYRRPIGGGSRGGGGKPAEYPWYDSDGNLHYAHYYEAMRQNAINHGTWSEATQQSTTTRTTTDRRGKTKSSSSSNTTKPAKGHSERPQGGKKPNPMDSGGNSGGGSKKKKKNPNELTLWQPTINENYTMPSRKITTWAVMSSSAPISTMRASVASSMMQRAKITTSAHGIVFHGS